MLEFLRLVDESQREVAETIRRALERDELPPQLITIDWSSPYAKDLEDVYAGAVIRWAKRLAAERPARRIPSLRDAYIEAYRALDACAKEEEKRGFSERLFYKALQALANFIFVVARGGERPRAATVANQLRRLYRRAQRAHLDDYAHIAFVLQMAFQGGKKDDGTIDFPTVASIYGRHLPVIVATTTSSAFVPFIAGHIYNTLIAAEGGAGEGAKPALHKEISEDYFRQQLLKAILERLVKQQRQGASSREKIPTSINELSEHGIVCTPNEAIEIISSLLFAWMMLPEDTFVPGVLLYGTRGTGKTAIAKQVAEMFRLPFLQLSATALRPDMLTGLVRGEPFNLGDFAAIKNAANELKEQLGLEVKPSEWGENEDAVRSALQKYLPQLSKEAGGTYFNILIGILTKDVPRILNYYKEYEENKRTSADLLSTSRNYLLDKERSAWANYLWWEDETSAQIYADLLERCRKENEKLGNKIVRILHYLNMLVTSGREILHLEPIGEFRQRAEQEFVLFMDEVGYNPGILLTFLNLLTGALLGSTKFRRVFVIAASNVEHEGAMPLPPAAYSRFVVLYLRSDAQSTKDYYSREQVKRFASVSYRILDRILKKLAERGIIRGEEGEGGYSYVINEEELAKAKSEIESKVAGAGESFAAFISTLVTNYNKGAIVQDNLAIWEPFVSFAESFKNQENGEEIMWQIGKYLGVPEKFYNLLKGVIKLNENLRREIFAKEERLKEIFDKLIPARAVGSENWEDFADTVESFSAPFSLSLNEKMSEIRWLIARYSGQGAYVREWQVSPSSRSVDASLDFLPPTLFFLAVLKNEEGKLIPLPFEHVVSELNRDDVFIGGFEAFKLDTTREEASGALLAQLIRIFAGFGGIEFAKTLVKEIRSALERIGTAEFPQMWNKGLSKSWGRLMGVEIEAVAQKPSENQIMREVKEIIEGIKGGNEAVISDVLNAIQEIFGVAGAAPVITRSFKAIWRNLLQKQLHEGTGGGANPTDGGSVTEKINNFVSDIITKSMSAKEEEEEVIRALQMQGEESGKEKGVFFVRLLFTMLTRPDIATWLHNTLGGAFTDVFGKTLEQLTKGALERVAGQKDEEEQVRFAAAYTNFLLALGTYSSRGEEVTILSEILPKWVIGLWEIATKKLAESALAGIPEAAKTHAPSASPEMMEAKSVGNIIAPVLRPLGEAISQSWRRILGDEETVNELLSSANYLARVGKEFLEPIETSLLRAGTEQEIADLIVETSKGKQIPKLLQFVLSLTFLPELKGTLSELQEIFAHIVLGRGEKLDRVVYSQGLNSQAAMSLQAFPYVLFELIRLQSPQHTEGQVIQLTSLDFPIHIALFLLSSTLTQYLKEEEEHLKGKLGNTVKTLQQISDAATLQGVSQLLGITSAQDLAVALILAAVIQRVRERVPSLSEDMLQNSLRNPNIQNKIDMAAQKFLEQHKEAMERSGIATTGKVLDTQRIIQIVWSKLNEIERVYDLNQITQDIPEVREAAQEVERALREVKPEEAPAEAVTEETPSGASPEEEIKELIKALLRKAIRGRGWI